MYIINFSQWLQNRDKRMKDKSLKQTWKEFWNKKADDYNLSKIEKQRCKKLTEWMEDEE